MLMTLGTRCKRRFSNAGAVPSDVFFGVVGSIAFGRQFGVGFGVPWAQGLTWMHLAFGGSMLPITPWLILSPMMSKMILTRTQNALTTLVTNAVQLPRTA
jgi:hypothetical protein